MADHLGAALTLVQEAFGKLDEALKTALDVSGKDHKTPLLNERRFQTDGEEILRLEDPASVVVFSGDINDFKDLNTKLGYEGADLVLFAVGWTLSHIVTPDLGFSYRRGGDEFAILLMQEHVDTVCTLIQTNLCPLVVPVEGKGNIEVFTSFGYSRIGPALSFHDNLKRADDAAKAAKWDPKSTVVEWFEDIKTGHSARKRCKGCRTQMNISVAPDRAKALPPLKCMVCGADLDS